MEAATSLHQLQSAPSQQQPPQAIPSQQSQANAQTHQVLEPLDVNLGAPSIDSGAQMGGHEQQQQLHQQAPHLHQLQPPSMTNSGQNNTSQQQLSGLEHLDEVGSEGHLGGSQAANSCLDAASLVADAGGPIVQWLVDNYEIADGESLPRSTVYNHYLSHCCQLQMASVNAASFGKLIRSVFVGLKTRRLGTRGHSKYHYFGVRAKAHVQRELNQHHHHHHNNTNENDNQTDSDSNGTIGYELPQTGARQGGRASSQSALGSSTPKRLRRQPLNQGHLQAQNGYHSQQQQHHQPQHPYDPQQGHAQHLAEHSAEIYVAMDQNQSIADMANGQPQCYTEDPNTHLHHLSNNHHQQQHPQQHQHHNQQHPGDPNGFGFGPNDSTGFGLTIQQSDLDLSQHLGANWATLVDEHWPEREPCALESELARVGAPERLAGALTAFESRYKTYYRRMVELLREIKIMDIERLWLEMWNPIGQAPSDALGATTGSSSQSTVVAEPPPNADATTEATWMRHNGDEHGYSAASNLHGYSNANHQLINADHQVTFDDLYRLTSLSCVASYVQQIDLRLYSAIESFLLPEVLSPIPSQLAHYIRIFAKNYAHWMQMALKNYDVTFSVNKCKVARVFGLALRRYVSLNHLATASRSIWGKRHLLTQMSQDLSRVDAREIEHQISLMQPNIGQHRQLSAADRKPQLHNPDETPSTTNVMVEASSMTPVTTDNNHHQQQQHQESSQQQTQVDVSTNQKQHQLMISSSLGDRATTTVTAPSGSHLQPAQLIQNILHLLEDPYPEASWPDWCKNLVESRVCGLSADEAMGFVLKWNFYITLILKELTLKRAPSSSSFQLIKLLFDDYIFYLVVTRLAQAQHKTTVQFMLNSND